MYILTNADTISWGIKRNFLTADIERTRLLHSSEIHFIHVYYPLRSTPLTLLFPEKEGEEEKLDKEKKTKQQIHTYALIFLRMHTPIKREQTNGQTGAILPSDSCRKVYRVIENITSLVCILSKQSRRSTEIDDFGARLRQRGRRIYTISLCTYSREWICVDARVYVSLVPVANDCIW